MATTAVSAKLTRSEFTLLKNHCDRRGITMSTLIRTLLQHELNVTVPAHVAGRNNITYDKEHDNYTWAIELDDGTHVSVLSAVSPSFLDQLQIIIQRARQERDTTILRGKLESVPVPGALITQKQGGTHARRRTQK